MGNGKTRRSELLARAVGQYGLLTGEDVRRIGASDRDLDKLTGRGLLTRVARSLYRLERSLERPEDGDHAAAAAALLRLGPQALLSHDSVLHLLHLTPGPPERIRVTLPERPRGEPPPRVQVFVGEVPAEERTFYRGLRCTTVQRAVLDCRPLLPRPLLHDAVDAAARQGLLLRRERNRLHEALEPA